MTEKKKFIPIYKRIAKVIKYLFLTLLTVIILVFGILQLPQVQTKIGQELANYITEKTGYEFQVEKVSIYWFDMASIKNLKVYDRQHAKMMTIDEVKVDFKISELTKNPIVIDEAIIVAPHVHLIRNTEDETLNFDDFIITLREAFTGETQKKNPKVIAFVISSAQIQNGYFTYNDLTQERNGKEEVFDKFHFSFKEINADVTRFYTHLDTISIDIRNLNTIEEKTLLHFDSLCTDFMITRHVLDLKNLITGVNKSLVNGDIRFEYDSIKHMSQFVDSINLVAHLEKTIIYTQDLAHFSPEVKSFYDKWVVTTDFIGTISNFDLENTDFRFGDYSHLNGHLGLKGLPSLYETLIDLDLKGSQIVPQDVKQYVGNSIYPSVEKFGTVTFAGDFFGFPTNFVAHGNASTSLGDLYSDLKFVINEKEGESKYLGHLKTYDFQLGKFLGRKDVGKISMNGKLDGEGFSVDNAHVKIKAHCNKFEYNKYAYKNIDIDALLEQGLFDGLMIIEDPNLHLTANGKVDFRNHKNLFDIYLSLDKADLRATHFTTDSSYFSGEMDLRFKGLDMDEIQGETTLKNMNIFYNNNHLAIDNFYFLSTKRDSTRKFLVKSNYFDVNIEGQYSLGSIYDHLIVLKDEMLLLIENNPEKTKKYYQNKPPAVPISAEYSIMLHDINPLLQLYYEDAMISNNTKITGDVMAGNTSIFNMYTEIDSVAFKKFTFRSTLLDVSIVKDSDSSTTLGIVHVDSKEQDYNGYPILKDLKFETLVNKEDIEFSLLTKDYDSDDFGKFSGNIQLKENATKICLNPSKLRIYNNSWRSKDSTFITIVNKSIQFDSLNFQSDSQRVVLHGMLAESSLTPLFIQFENLDLDGLIELPGKLPLEGRLDGKIVVSDFYRNLTLFGDLMIDDVIIDDIFFGDLDGKIKWENKRKALVATSKLSRGKKEILVIDGKYDLKNDLSPLDFQIDITDSHFNILEPFLLGNATKLKGKGSGKIKISGDFPRPFFKGELTIEGGAFTLPYFNTRYYFDDKIAFSEDKIQFNNLSLHDSLNHFGIDKAGHKATLNGTLSHNFFDDFKFNMVLDLDRMLILDTKEGQNSLYFGSGVATGKINVYGPLNDIVITSDKITTERNTNITLLSSSTDVSGPFNVEGLRFKQPKNAQGKRNKPKTSNTELNYEIRMSFNITPFAQFKVIYDEEVFEVKKGKGELEMVYNSKGDFNLYNTYTIMEGSYNFKFANLVNKKFIANPGSKITWTGDPYDGKLDVTALYKIQTSLAPILDSTSVDMRNPDSKKSYPVVLVMNINGKISAPEFTFDINFEDYPLNMPAKPSGLVSTENFISQFKNDIHNNEQELNRQVFSLLVLQSLAYKNSYSGSGGAVSGSVNELIANQMSAWLSEVDDNLEIDLDLSGLSNEEVKALRMRLTYSILDGRVRITRDGNINTTDNQDEANALIGEWTVEYLLTDDGRVRIKAYNKTNQTTAASTSYYSDNSQVYGASVVFSKDFDSLGDLLGLDKKKKKKEKKKEEKRTDTGTLNEAVEIKEGNNEK